MNKLLSLLMAGFIAGYAAAQCSEPTSVKIMLIGDSWASFMNIDQTFNTALKNWGHSGYRYISNTTVAENGTETNDFLTASKLNAIKTLFAQHPNIKVVHMSIGGNDFLGDWKKSFSPGKTDTLFMQVKGRLLAIVDSLKSFKPGVHIVWSGYCYPNFREVIQTSGLGSAHPFYDTWQKMEFPEFIEINSLLNRVSDSVAAYAAGDPQFHFVPAMGILQYTFGQTTPLGVPPGGTFQPYTVPLPYGDPNYPSNKNSMRDYFLTKDCFHLSPTAYLDFIEYQMQKFYHKFLMDDFYALSDSAYTGSVSSQGNVTPDVLIGEQGGEVFAAHLSFQTNSLQNKPIARASVFLRRESLSGSNPVNANLQLKIKSGSFSGSASIEAADFSAAGDAVGSACVYGVSNADKKWFRLDLPASFYPYISNQHPVQITIAPAQGFTGGRVKLSGATDPDFAPVLNVVYQQNVGVDDAVNAETANVFPNPASDYLQLETNGSEIHAVTLYDITGRSYPTALLDDNRISTVHLNAGHYFVIVTTSQGILTARFVKE